MKNTEENREKIGKIWKKGKLNSGKIWKIKWWDQQYDRQITQLTGVLKPIKI
jgi:hypothetical protein